MLSRLKIHIILLIGLDVVRSTDNLSSRNNLLIVMLISQSA